MQLTTEYIRTYFNKFNKEYFDCSLPDTINFEITNSKHKLGQFCCTKRKSWLLRRPRPIDCVIKISKYYDIEEREIQNTLLHEMIHYYIICNGLTDSSPHGRIFQWHMNRLNKQFGWNITIRQDITDWKVAPHNLKSNYLVMALELEGDKFVFSVVNPQYKEKINKEAERCKDLKSIRWFSTSNSYFVKYNKVRSFRGLFVDRETYYEKFNALIKEEGEES